MKLYWTFILTASLLFPLVSSGREGTFYVSPFGGVTIFRDGHVFVDNFLSGDADFEINNGYSAGLRMGYDFSPVRLEGEFSYAEGSIDSLHTATGTVQVDSEVETLSYMLNLLWDFDYRPFVFTVGAGAGASRVKFGEMSDGVFVAVAETRDTVFAFQGIVRAAWHFNNQSALGVNYRHLITHDVKGRGYVGTNILERSDIEYDRLGIHLIEVFLLFRF